MTNVTLYTAAATHGFYGPILTETDVGFTREEAVRNVLTKLHDRMQKDHQQRLDSEMLGIIQFLQQHDRWNGGNNDTESVNEEYIHVVVEQVTLYVDVKVNVGFLDQ